MADALKQALDDATQAVKDAIGRLGDIAPLPSLDLPPDLLDLLLGLGSSG